jgi:hypothetical protein
MINQKFDGLNSWREETGKKNDNNVFKRYEGGSEYDYTVEVLKQYYKEKPPKEKTPER